MASAPVARSRTMWERIVASLGERVRATVSGISFNRRRGLRLCESLSLGNKRLVAVVEYDDQRFLVGVTAESISLLQSLGPTQREELQETK
jgi:flagellar biogenesis protein FliO